MVGKQQLALNPRQNSYLALLDQRTIEKICEYLSLLDLLQFSEVDVNYQRLIGEKIITKRSFTVWRFQEHYDVRKAFKQFGEFVKKLIIYEKDIQYKDEKYTGAEEMFRLIKKYCVAGKLNSVTIGFDKDSETLEANKFLDVFSELKSLAIFIQSRRQKFIRAHSLQGLLNKLLANCTKLQSLKLDGMQSNCENAIAFLTIPQMYNLQSLCFHYCTIPHQSWLEFIAAGVRPSLKSLKFEYSSFTSRPSGRKLKEFARPNQSEFIQEVVHAFPSLDTFIVGYDKWATPNPDCGALTKLQHLRKVCILEPKYSNLIQSIARPCSRPCQVQQLALKLTGIQSPPLSIINLTNLRLVEFFEPNIKHLVVYKWFLKLPRLTQFYFSDENKVYSYTDLKILVSEIVKASENLQVFRVFIKHHSCILSKQYYHHLVNLRINRFPGAPPLHLCAKFKRMKKEQTFPKIIQLCDFYNCRFLS